MLWPSASAPGGEADGYAVGAGGEADGYAVGAGGEADGYPVGRGYDGVVVGAGADGPGDLVGLGIGPGGLGHGHGSGEIDGRGGVGGSSDPLARANGAAVTPRAPRATTPSPASTVRRRAAPRIALFERFTGTASWERSRSAALIASSMGVVNV